MVECNDSTVGEPCWWSGCLFLNFFTKTGRTGCTSFWKNTHSSREGKREGESERHAETKRERESSCIITSEGQLSPVQCSSRLAATHIIWASLHGSSVFYWTPIFTATHTHIHTHKQGVCGRGSAIIACDSVRSHLQWLCARAVSWGRKGCSAGRSGWE